MNRLKLLELIGTRSLSAGREINSQLTGIGRCSNSSNIGYLLRRKSSSIQDQPKVQHDSLDFNGTLKDAEKVIGYTTSFLNLRWILNDEMANVAWHIRKLIGTDHPLLDITKNYLLKNNTPAWGLLVLLLSKTAGVNIEVADIDKDRTSGVLHSQRVLAEVTEMMRTSIVIHNGILIVKANTQNEDDLHYGNKLALLSGDFLLGKSFSELAIIRNTHVHELIASAIRDLSECNFIGQRDEQSIPLPAEPINTTDSCITLAEHNIDYGPYKTVDIFGNPQDEWILRNILGGATLLGKSCKAALLLGGHSSETQEKGYLFGKYLALALQLNKEYKEFISNKDSNFSLISAPVMLHLKNDPSLYSEIKKGLNNVNNCDYVKIRQAVNSGSALKEVKELQRNLITRTLNNLKQFEENDARVALENIICNM